MIMPDSSELRKVNDQLKRISKNLLNKHKSIPGSVNKVMLVEANNLRNYIIESMQRTPKSSVGYKRRSVTHYPSQPGNPPAIDTAELIRAILYDVKDMELRIGNMGGAPYGGILEDPEDTRPNGRRRWLNPAVEANKERMIGNIQDAIKKEFRKI
jgi:hypothetical protein